MRAEWNQRARSDAYYYVANARRKQAKGEFLSTADAIVAPIRSACSRIHAAESNPRRALEIGCGPGRLMLRMKDSFDEVHGVDVSDDMVELARENLGPIPGMFVHRGSGSDLAGLPSHSFDFVYSYAVFQHIPRAELVTRYLEESARVLKAGGVLACHLRGAPTASWQNAGEDDTWFGCVYPPGEVSAVCRRCDLELLQITGVETLYTWVVARRRMPGSSSQLDLEKAIVKAVTPTANPLGMISRRGPGAGFHCWLEGFPESLSLERLEITVAGLPAVACYISDHLGRGGFQLNALMPLDCPCGEALVRLACDGLRVRGEHLIRVGEYPDPTPAVVSVTDGADLLADHASTSGTLKIMLSGVKNADAVGFAIGSKAVKATRAVLYDAYIFGNEFTLTLPDGLSDGPHTVVITAPGWVESVEFTNHAAGG